jgi:hypothetical protein
LHSNSPSSFGSEEDNVQTHVRDFDALQIGLEPTSNADPTVRIVTPANTSRDSLSTIDFLQDQPSGLSALSSEEGRADTNSEVNPQPGHSHDLSQAEVPTSSYPQAAYTLDLREVDGEHATNKGTPRHLSGSAPLLQPDPALPSPAARDDARIRLYGEGDSHSRDEKSAPTNSGAVDAMDQVV